MEAQEIVSCDGINSPFVSGGVAGDAIREIRGNYGRVFTNTQGLSPNGAYSATPVSTIDWNYGSVTLFEGEFNSSRVVPTGTENSPRTFSVQYWRRVA